MSQKRTLSEAVNSMSVSIVSDTHSLDEDFNSFLPVRSLTFLSINSRERALSEVKVQALEPLTPLKKAL